MEAESGGNPQAHGDLSFGQGGGQYVGSLGIWQIFGQAHPSVTPGCAEDPNCATDAARQISNNWTDWAPWSTFNSGAYRQFLQGNVPPQQGGAQTFNAPGAAVPGAVGSVIGSWFGALFSHDPAQIAASWENGGKDLAWRAGLIVVGVVLVWIGTMILFRPTAEAAVGVATGGTFQRIAGRRTV